MCYKTCTLKQLLRASGEGDNRNAKGEVKSLIECGKPVICEFIALGFGRLKLDITVEDGVISHASVRRDAPCGCTWHVAKKFNWTDVADYKETVSSAHHTYQCTTSMEGDTELEDTILHQTGYIIREAVEEGLGDCGEGK